MFVCVLFQVSGQGLRNRCAHLLVKHIPPAIRAHLHQLAPHIHPAIRAHLRLRPSNTSLALDQRLSYASPTLVLRITGFSPQSRSQFTSFRPPLILISPSTHPHLALHLFPSRPLALLKNQPHFAHFNSSHSPRTNLALTSRLPRISLTFPSQQSTRATKTRAHFTSKRKRHTIRFIYILRKPYP